MSTGYEGPNYVGPDPGGGWQVEQAYIDYRGSFIIMTRGKDFMCRFSPREARQAYNGCGNSVRAAEAAAVNLFRSSNVPDTRLGRYDS